MSSSKPSRKGERRTGNQHTECHKQRPKGDLPPIAQWMSSPISGAAMLSDDEEDTGSDIGE